MGSGDHGYCGADWKLAIPLHALIEDCGFARQTHADYDLFQGTYIIASQRAVVQAGSNAVTSRQTFGQLQVRLATTITAATGPSSAAAGMGLTLSCAEPDTDLPRLLPVFAAPLLLLRQSLDPLAAPAPVVKVTLEGTLQWPFALSLRGSGVGLLSVCR